MRVYHDFFCTRIQINVSWCGSGSGSGQMIRIRNTLVHSLVNEWTIIYYYTFRSYCKLSLFTYTFPFFPLLKTKFCKMNKKYNNVWMSIRSLVNEYLKMSWKVWQWNFGVWSPGLYKVPYIFWITFLCFFQSWSPEGWIEAVSPVSPSCSVMGHTYRFR